MKQLAVVVPSCRKESIEIFIKKWNVLSSNDYTLFVIEDHPTKEFNLPGYIEHYCHEDIDKEFPNPKLIPKYSDGIRDFGFWKAYKEGYQYVLTLDDDCWPINQSFMDILDKCKIYFDRSVRNNKWFHTLLSDYPRGVSKSDREKYTEIKLCVGSWANVPDLDGLTQKSYEINNKPFPKAKMNSEVVPYGQLYSMSGMSLLFETKFAPYMYYLPTFDTYHRTADIYLGFIIKRYLDEVNEGIVNAPFVIWHSRASNTDTNIEKENFNDGIAINDKFAKYMFNSYRYELNGIYGVLDYVAGCYGKDDYFKKASDNFKDWIKCF